MLQYVNDVIEAGEDVVRGIYGDAKYQRLVALKRLWDPDNVFRLNQECHPPAGQLTGQPLSTRIPPESLFDSALVCS